MPVTLIPKKKRKEPSIKLGAVFGDIQMAATFAILVFVAVIYAGLSFYERGLNKEVSAIVSRAQKIAQERDINLENEAQSLAKRMDAIEGLLGSHVYASNIFTAIEQTTHPTVSFGRLSLKIEADSEGNGADIVSLEGAAPSYKALGEQTVILKEDSRFSDVRLFSIKSERSGDVSFTVEFKIGEELFRQK